MVERRRPLDAISARALDIVGALLAVAYSLPTLLYPFSRDHALFSYVGRVWLRGGLPYRDVYDFKPPGIFALNALATAVFGYNQWGIRLLEIGGVLLAAWCITLAVRRDSERARGELGANALLFVGLYYTTFNYWDTSQTEFWEGLCVLAAYAVAENVASVRRAAWVSGALVGAAVLFKFPAPVIGVVCTVVVTVRGAREGSTSRERLMCGGAALLFHGVGAAAVVLAVALYFAARGGWNDMIDMLFRHLWDFHVHTSVAPGDALFAFKYFWLHLFGMWTATLALAWTVAVVCAVRRRAWGVVRGAVVAIVMLGLATVTVTLQGRYVLYQWGITVPFVALCGGYAVAELGRARRGVALVVVAVAVLGVFALTSGHMDTPYREVYASSIAYVDGRIDRWTFLALFRGPFGYSYRAEERIGDILRERAKPGDQVEVRGYEPAVYIVSGLMSPSRFAVEIPLFLPGLTFKRAEWQAEHDRSVWGARPRFFVTFLDGLEERHLLESRSYRELARCENLVAFERQDP
jgi:hypothetical protein